MSRPSRELKELEDINKIEDEQYIEVEEVDTYIEDDDDIDCCDRFADKSRYGIGDIYDNQ